MSTKDEDQKPKILVLGLRNFLQRINNTEDDFLKFKSLLEAGKYLGFDPFILRMRLVFDKAS